MGPYRVADAAPTLEAARAFMLLSLNSDMSCPFYTLDSEDHEESGDITITDSVNWLFSVPPQPLPLRAGLWYWSFRVVDTAGVTTEIDTGRLMVRP